MQYNSGGCRVELSMYDVIWVFQYPRAFAAECEFKLHEPFYINDVLVVAVVVVVSVKSQQVSNTNKEEEEEAEMNVDLTRII